MQISRRSHSTGGAVPGLVSFYARDGVGRGTCRADCQPLALLQARDDGRHAQPRRPPGFDLPSFWNAWCAEFERTRPSYSVVLRVQPALVPALRGIFGEGIGRQIAERGRTEAGGSLVLPLTFESQEIAQARLLGLGPATEVLSPADLRERMARQAAAICALYGRAAPEAESSTE